MPVKVKLCGKEQVSFLSSTDVTQSCSMMNVVSFVPALDNDNSAFS